MKFNLLTPQDQLVEIISLIYKNKMTTISGGNLSIKDKNGDIWITPAAIDKGKLKPDDIMCVTSSGEISGKHKPSSEFPFHKSIYDNRPDLKAIIHAHPPALVSFSILKKVPDTNIIPRVKKFCGEVGYADYALPGSQKLGDNIAATFKEGYNSVLLENHGIVIGSDALINAFHKLETLEHYSRSLIQAAKIGKVIPPEKYKPDESEDCKVDPEEFLPGEKSDLEKNLRSEIIDIIKRSCENQLMGSTEGVVSMKIDESSFLITPTGIGRRNVEEEDLVLMENGMREKGKFPSRSVLLHEAIYKCNPGINAIISAQPPNVQAYAVSDVDFNTRTIPESYIVLRSIEKIPYEYQFNNREAVAKTVSLESPVVLLQNDCLLTTGKNLFEAFDRLEVAEFSAKSSIDAKSIGIVKPMGDKEIDEIIKFFL
ncbi:MAG: class II aldolase/adducin family protein [Melioribacteraceae bacterium]|nr:class II aldolase/adducin family protein [Melioribacteraceae bacterium]